MKLNAMLCWAFLGLAAAATQPRSQTLRRWEFAEPHLGTQARLVIYASEDPREAAKAAFSEIERLNRIFSDYDETSELMKLCRAPAGRPHALSAELATVLGEAQRLARETDGAFDITAGPYSQLWRRARRQKQLPTSAALLAARPLVGFRLLTLDAKGEATLAKAGMRLDLGAIAKGAVAEAVKEKLAAQHRACMVALGGDFALGSAPPGEDGWKIQVGPNDAKLGPSLTLLLADCAVSTSGDLEQFFEHQGKRYAHILDPRTGWGVLDCPLVTVTAPRGGEADSLATALCVLPIEQGQKLVASKPGVAARWLVPHPTCPATEVVSPRWPQLRRPKP